MPEPRQVFTERQYLLSIVLGDRDRLLATPCVVFLLDLVRAPQPLFPGPLQRASHQAVLGLHGVILAPRALGVVASPLALERPLPLHRPGLLFDLAQRGERQRDPIRRQRRQDQPLDFGIDRESP